MEWYVQTGIGITVSLAFFAISYRRTVGARRERASNANASMVETLRKRIILEDYQPTVMALALLIRGKARGARVPMGDLYTPELLIAAVFSEAISDDLLEENRRAMTLKRLEGLIASIEGAEEKDSDIESGPNEQIRRQRQRAVLAMGAATSIAGSLAALLPFADRGDDGVVGPYLAAVVGSVALIAAALSIARVRLAQEGQPDLETARQRAAEFETEVLKALRRVDGAETEHLGRPVDFVAIASGKRIGIEIRMWPKRVPAGTLGRSLALIEKRAREGEVSQVFVVVPESDELSTDSYGDGYVKIVSAPELSDAVRSALFESNQNSSRPEPSDGDVER